MARTFLAVPPTTLRDPPVYLWNSSGTDSLDAHRSIKTEERTEIKLGRDIRIFWFLCVVGVLFGTGRTSRTKPFPNVFSTESSGEGVLSVLCFR
jgi:hypothetical protein